MTKPGYAKTFIGGLMLGGVVLAGANCFPGLEQALLEGVEMESAASCSALEDSMKQRALSQAELRSIMAVTGGRFSPSGFESADKSNFTDTNNQEEGIHEADLMKVDEHFAYAVHNGKLIIVEAVPQEGTPAGGENFQIESAKLIGQLSIDGQPFEMFVDGDRAMIMTRTTSGAVKELFASDAPSRDQQPELLKAVLVDITDRSEPKLMREVFFEGNYLSSRRINGKAYIAMRAELNGGLDPNDTPGSDENWLSRRRAAIERASLDNWLPSYYDVRYARAGNIAEKSVKRCSCRQTFSSDAGAGDSTLTIYSLDMIDGKQDITNTTVVGDGGHVYASDRSIVIALSNNHTRGGERPDDNFNFGDEEVSSSGDAQVTFLHRFAISSVDGKVNYDSSGVVDGWILNQFALSEHEGILRVATQIGARGTPEAHSAVFTLEIADKGEVNFNVGGDRDSYLKVIGAVDGIAPGEDMYAARFVGDRAYLVTFQETDPLWNINLKNPSRPTIDGELEVPGFSTYLHPISGSRLLAVGRAGFNGNEGIKLSLFDVSKDDPTVIREKSVGGPSSVSEALTDHRAFRFMPEYNILAVPMTLTRSNGLQLYKVSNSQPFDHITRVDHEEMDQGGDKTIRRAYRVGRNLFAISGVGLSITDLETMETVAQVDLDDE